MKRAGKILLFFIALIKEAVSRAWDSLFDLHL